MPRKFPIALWLALPLAFLLYFYHLSAVGVIGPDEPRYASIAREMAASGDWVTPRLNGSPWFEKPALLYWLEAVFFRLGFGAELAPRLPMALIAVAFLIFFWWILHREFGALQAWLSTLILGTSAAWIVCSQVAVPDLPLTAAFSAAMLLGLPWVVRRDPKFLPITSALLGVAVLAKGPVAVVLAAPLLLGGAGIQPAQASEPRLRIFSATGLRLLLAPRVLIPFFLVTLPWYVLCTMRNGTAFLKDFFWKHNVERFTSASALLHGQPFWYYFAVLPGLLLPWTPLAILLFRRDTLTDQRRVFLLSWVALVFVFFSISANKLPAYILPLVPAAAALLGDALAEARRAAPWLAICALLLAAFPIAAPILPDAVSTGLTHAAWPPFRWYWLLPLLAAAAVWFLETSSRRAAAVFCIAASAVAGTVWLKYTAAPGLDRVASSRALWMEISPRESAICIDWMPRAQQYSLDYYAGTPLPDCASTPRPVWLSQLAGQLPRLSAPH